VQETYATFGEQLSGRGMLALKTKPPGGDPQNRLVDIHEKIPSGCGYATKLPSGNLTWLLKMASYSGLSH